MPPGRDGRTMATASPHAPAQAPMSITDLRHFLDASRAIGPARSPALAMAQFQTDVLACATDGTSPASEATVVWKAWRMAAFATVDGASNHERIEQSHPPSTRCFDSSHATCDLLRRAVGANGPARSACGSAAHRPCALRRRCARHRACRRPQGAGGDAGADPLRDGHQHGRDRRRHLRLREAAGRDGEDRPRGGLGRDLPRSATSS